MVGSTSIIKQGFRKGLMHNKSLDRGVVTQTTRDESRAGEHGEEQFMTNIKTIFRFPACLMLLICTKLQTVINSFYK